MRAPTDATGLLLLLLLLLVAVGWCPFPLPHAV